MTPESKAAYLGPIVATCIQVGMDLPAIRELVPGFLALLDLDKPSNRTAAEPAHVAAAGAAQAFPTPAAPAITVKIDGNYAETIPEVGEAAPAVTIKPENDGGGDHVAASNGSGGAAISIADTGASPPSIPERKPRGWWPGPGRALLQAEVDAGHTMMEAASALKATHSQIATAASSLQIKFGGRGGARHGFGRRPASPQRRFTDKPALDPEAVRALPSTHLAVTGGRTLFPTTVVDANDSDRVLVSGAHSRKLGDRIIKGLWAGMPIFTLTLEERATCPRSCAVWDRCYGNGMPLARRHAFTPSLLLKLELELAILNERHEDGFAVRLHNLGDFPTVDYAVQWVDWLIKFDRLHVFGYTAHIPSDSAIQSLASPIGAVIEAANRHHRDRWFIRFSVPSAHAGPGRATTIWRQPEGDRVPEGIVCPAQTGKTDCCGTCALCWEPNADKETIVFVGHGPKWGGRPAVPANVAANQAAAKKLPPDAIGPKVIEVEPAIKETATHFAKPLQRRCEGCKCMFVTKIVEQVLCLDCMRRGVKPKPAPELVAGHYR